MCGLFKLKDEEEKLVFLYIPSFRLYKLRQQLYSLSLPPFSMLLLRKEGLETE